MRRKILITMQNSVAKERRYLNGVQRGGRVDRHVQLRQLSRRVHAGQVQPHGVGLLR